MTKQPTWILSSNSGATADPICGKCQLTDRSRGDYVIVRSVLRVGDRVQWRGSWGTEEPKPARVLVLERTRKGEKYGTDVPMLAWDTVRAGNAVVTLDNGSWAYGYQLEPIADTDK